MPRYSSETATNLLLCQILYSIMGIMTLVTLLVTAISSIECIPGRYVARIRRCKYRTRRKSVPVPYIKHNGRVIKQELQRLRVGHLVQPEEIVSAVGTTTLVMKMPSKLKCMGRKYRMYELMSKKVGIQSGDATEGDALREQLLAYAAGALCVLLCIIVLYLF